MNQVGQSSLLNGLLAPSSTNQQREPLFEEVTDNNETTTRSSFAPQFSDGQLMVNPTNFREQPKTSSYFSSMYQWAGAIAARFREKLSAGSTRVENALYVGSQAAYGLASSAYALGSSGMKVLRATFSFRKEEVAVEDPLEALDLKPGKTISSKNNQYLEKIRSYYEEDSGKNKDGHIEL